VNAFWDTLPAVTVTAPISTKNEIETIPDPNPGVVEPITGSPPVSKIPVKVVTTSGVVELKSRTVTGSQPVRKSPVKTVAKTSKSPTKKPVPMDPKSKAIMELRTKQQTAKAKAELIAKLKVLEIKRKAEIERRNTELAKFAKDLPPVDKYKFPGMPGPPPFKPKAANVAKDVVVLPTSLAPPSVEDVVEDDEIE
jgi:hypothetical protein